MNYYHVIYNSSEKNRRGMVGFGVRTATQGIPDEVLAAMQSAEVFNFDTSRPMLTPATLMAEPNKVLDIPATYFYTVVPVPGAQPVYVLGRKIAVGFDYVYYKNFKAGRLGNYVVDCYVFDAVPPREAFELFYECPAAGSNYFVPRSPVPCESNEEMAALSLGAQPDLAPERRPFSAAQLPPIDGIALELVFALIEAHNQDKPLLINGSTEGTAQVMAHVFRLLPQSMIGQATFITNYQQEGRKKGIAIIEKNELYPYQVFAKQFVTYDLRGGQAVDTVEATGYRKALRQAIDNGDLDTVHRKLEWLMSDAYNAVKGQRQSTIDSLYNYFVEHKLDVEAFYSDTAFLTLLGRYVEAHPDLRGPIDAHVSRLLADVSTPQEALSAIARLRLLRQFVNLDAVVSRGRAHLADVVLASPAAFKQFYAGSEGVLEQAEAYVDLTRMAQHPDYLSAFEGNDWLALCDRFLPNHRQDLAAFVARTFTDHLAPQLRDRAIDNAQRDPMKVVDACMQLLHGTQAASFEGELLQYISSSLVDRIDYYDFIAHLPAKSGDERYAPLFDWQLLKLIEGDTIDQAVDKLTSFAGSPAMLQYIADGNGYTLQRLATKLEKWLVESGRRREVMHLTGDVLGAFKPTILARYMSPFVVMNNVAAGDADENSWDSEADLRDAQRLAVQMRDTKYMAQLLPASLAAEPNSEWINSLLDLQVASPDELMQRAATLKPAVRDFYFKVILQRIKKHTGSPEMEQLQKCGGMTAEEAEVFLKENFPEVHARYLKSLEPSIADKMGDFFRGIFKKK